MENVNTEDRYTDRKIREGLRILAKIIARDFMAKSKLDGDCQNGSAEMNNENSLYREAI